MLLRKYITSIKMQYKNEYRRSIEEYRPAVPIRRKIGLYWILAILRIALTFLPQTGYIHPDEYFQSIEVISGDYFDIDVYKPWEFNASFPIRTVVIPQLTVGTSYSILQRLSSYTSFYFGITLKSPYFLLLFPRLMMCCLSFISDYCLYKICCMYGQNYKVRLVTFASSYVTLTYLTRTFSNSIELMFTSLLLYYTTQCMIYSEKVVIQSDHLTDKYDKAKTGIERVKYYKLKASLPSHSLNHCFKLATITVIGIFNRPTFIVYALAPVFFWLQRGLGSKSIGFRDFHIRIFTFITCGIPAAVIFILVDSFYFGYLTLGEIGSLQISMNNFVVTPLNFLRYNANVKNLESHGLHPYFTHFLVNVPLLFNVLGFIGLFTFGQILRSGLKGRWLDMPRIQSIVGLMTASFVIPVTALSMFPHQEPRFIIPVLFPLVFLHSPTLSQTPGVDTVARIIATANAENNSTTKQYRFGKLRLLWFICNLGLTIFYGFAHQGGVFPMTRHIATELKAKPYLTHIHLYTSYTYSLPTALLQLRNTKKTYISDGKHKYKLTKDFHIYEQGSRDLGEVHDDILMKLHDCEAGWVQKKIPYRLYYALPVAALDEFIEYTLQNNSDSFDYRTVNIFYPHISTEKLPALNVIDNIISINSAGSYTVKFITSAMNNIVNLLKEFGLVLLKIEKSAPGIDAKT